jgi:hypothetical protein
MMADEHITSEQAQQLARQFNAAMQPIREGLTAIGQAFQAMVPHIQQQMDQVATAWRDVIYPKIHESYLADGAPYGDTYEGLLQWVKEMGEIRRHMEAIEAIRPRQWAVADFARQLREKRQSASPDEDA